MKLGCFYPEKWNTLSKKPWNCVFSHTLPPVQLRHSQKGIPPVLTSTLAPMQNSSAPSTRDCAKHSRLKEQDFALLFEILMDKWQPIDPEMPSPLQTHQCPIAGYGPTLNAGLILDGRLSHGYNTLQAYQQAYKWQLSRGSHDHWMHALHSLILALFRHSFLRDLQFLAYLPCSDMDRWRRPWVPPPWSLLWKEAVASNVEEMNLLQLSLSPESPCSLWSNMSKIRLLRQVVVACAVKLPSCSCFDILSFHPSIALAEDGDGRTSIRRKTVPC